MTTRTKPGEKYKAALLWCEMNRKKLPPNAKIHAMHKETLYGFLDSINVRWSSARKYWYTVAGKADPLKVRHNGFSVGVALSKRVSVRITASQDVMGAVLAEFTELCEALDWHVSVSPKRYPNGDDGYERVYVEVIRERL